MNIQNKKYLQVITNICGIRKQLTFLRSYATRAVAKSLILFHKTAPAIWLLFAYRNSYIISDQATATMYLGRDCYLRCAMLGHRQ